MVGTGGNIPSRRKGAGDVGSEWGRGEGRRRYRAMGENGQELKTGDIMYRIKHIRGVEYSIPMSYVLGLEIHHPTTSMPWGHGDRSKRNKLINKLFNKYFNKPTIKIMGSTKKRDKAYIKRKNG